MNQKSAAELFQELVDAEVARKMTSSLPPSNVRPTDNTAPRYAIPPKRRQTVEMAPVVVPKGPDATEMAARAVFTAAVDMVDSWVRRHRTTLNNQETALLTAVETYRKTVGDQASQAHSANPSEG